MNNKFLIVGLGNVGMEYNNTRHNIGFEVLDFLLKKHQGEFTLNKYAMTSELKLKNKSLILVKPTTFMNLSGKAVKFYMDQYKLPLENLLVITDDLAIDVAVLRLRLKGSHGGHNGLRNIEELMQTQNYARLRFGIGNQFAKHKQVDFVLGKWTENEQILINQTLEKAALCIESFVLEGASNAMTKYNG